MIIGIDATQANKKERSGVEWYAYHIIREMITLQSEHQWRLYFRNTPRTDMQNLGEHVEYRILKWPLKYLWTQIRLSYETNTQKPDVLFIPSQIIPLIHPTKTMTTLHDIAFKLYPKAYRWRSRIYLHIAAKHATRLPIILTVSKFSKAEIQKYYSIDPDNIIVTPLGTRMNAIKTSTQTADKPYILYVGRLEHKKNLVTLIDTFDILKHNESHKKLQLRLIGPLGYGSQQIFEHIKHSQNKNDIMIKGWIAETDKAQLMQQAQAVVLLSDYEGFGLPVIEAMRLGTPVVTSRQGSLPEITIPEATIQHHRDPEAVATVLNRVLSDTTFRAELIEKGIIKSQGYNWHETAKKTLAALEQAQKA